jgi:predicted nucleic acid-binding protein
MHWIADTGPLLHLHQAGLLDLLNSGEDIRTTPAVVAEWESKVPGANLPEWVRVEKPGPNAIRIAKSWREEGLLDRGEAESLAHAVIGKAAGYLTDDTAAREFAREENLLVRGSLGVLLMTVARNRLSAGAARTAWHRLAHDSTLWISPSLRREVETALERILTQNNTSE